MPNRQIINGEPYRYAYQGQEKDPETGKEAFQLRLWDARIGRWLTTDPKGEFSSPYLGMGNNPLNKIDPDGGSTASPETIYKFGNKTVEVKDGVNRTVLVDAEGFAKAQEFASMGDFGSFTNDQFNDYLSFFDANVYGSSFQERLGNLGWKIFDDEFGRRPTNIIQAIMDSPVLPGGGPVKAVKYAPKTLLSLKSTEYAAQATDKVADIAKAMQSGDIWIFSEKIMTYVHKGKTYILDGHHRIEAAKQINYSIEAIQFTSKKQALDFFKNNRVMTDKILDIHRGLFN